jgi:hypothetical protein
MTHHGDPRGSFNDPCSRLRADQWQEVGRHISGVADFLEGSKNHPEIVYCCVLHDGVTARWMEGRAWQTLDIWAA